VMPLSEQVRRSDGEPALVSSLEDFKKNFAIFSEGALMNLDWSHVVGQYPLPILATSKY